MFMQLMWNLWVLSPKQFLIVDKNQSTSPQNYSNLKLLTQISLADFVRHCSNLTIPEIELSDE